MHNSVLKLQFSSWIIHKMNDQYRFSHCFPSLFSLGSLSLSLSFSAGIAPRAVSSHRIGSDPGLQSMPSHLVSFMVGALRVSSQTNFNDVKVWPNPHNSPPSNKSSITVAWALTHWPRVQWGWSPRYGICPSPTYLTIDYFFLELKLEGPHDCLLALRKLSEIRRQANNLFGWYLFFRLATQWTFAYGSLIDWRGYTTKVYIMLLWIILAYLYCKNWTYAYAFKKRYIFHIREYMLLNIHNNSNFHWYELN